MVSNHPEDGMLLRTTELGHAMTAGRYWRWTAWGLGGLLGCALSACVYLGSLPHWKPYYVEIDTCGGSVRVVGAAPETYTIHQLAVNQAVRQFVTNLRSISTDQEVTKGNWRALEAQVTPRGGHKLVQYEQEYAPLQKREVVVVEQVRVFPRMVTTFDVRWQEATYSTSGARRERLSVTLYSGLFTVERREPRTPEEREAAPLGLFFDNWQFDKES